MAEIFSKNINGEYYYKAKVDDWNPVYRDSLLKYINCIAPLFQKAKEKNEFEYILTLLQYRGLSTPGYIPFENTISIFKEIFIIQEKIKDANQKLNITFWAYAHWIEASEPYEIFGNFLNIINGGKYTISNFPKKPSGKYTREQYPHEKINHLQSVAEIVNMEKSLIPVIEVYDRELRNSIFHSDYSIYDQQMRSYKDFDSDETYEIVNKFIAYYYALTFLYDTAIEDYEYPTLVKIPSYFNNQQFATTMSRKGHGLVGIKDNYTREELARGQMPWHIVRLLGYELKMLKNDPTIKQFPKNKVENFNKILKRTPRFLRKIFKKQIDKIENKLTVA